MNSASLSISEPLAPNPGRRFVQLSWFCALSPFTLLLLYVTVGIHIRLGLGHWPTPVLEDYHTPAFGFHQYILGYFILFASLGAAPLWLLCLLLPAVRPSWPRTVTAQLVTCALGWLLIFDIIHFEIDPTSFTAWFLD